MVVGENLNKTIFQQAKKVENFEILICSYTGNEMPDISSVEKNILTVLIFDHVAKKNLKCDDTPPTTVWWALTIW